MIDGAIVSGLASTSFLWFAVVIGIIVSFDVAVLEFTRKYRDESLESVDPERNRMRVLHPLFHGGSFLIYTIVIALVQLIPIKIPELIDVEIPERVIPAFMYFISVIVFIFVWMTYKEKIAEDNSTKTGAVDEIERHDMRGLVSFTQWAARKIGQGDKALGAALAGAVAVDMLAISALIKDYVLPTNYKGTVADPIAQLTGVVLVDIILFSIIISLVVFVAVVFAQALGRWLRHDSRLTIPFRLLEPLVVFFIGMETVRATIGYMQESFVSGVNEHSFAVDLLFAALIVLSLVVGCGHSPRKLFGIWRKDSFEISHEEGNENASDQAEKSAKSINMDQADEEVSDDGNQSSRKTFICLLIVLFVTMAVIFGSIWISYLTVDPNIPHNHLVEATAIFSAVFSVAITAAMYLPLNWLDKFETDDDFNFVKVKDIDSWKLLGPIAGAALGSASVVSFGWMYFGRNIETDVIGLWLSYLIIAWLLFQLRCLRFLRRGDVNGIPRRASDADFSELISAFGVASSAVALIATLWATGLLAAILQFD